MSWFKWWKTNGELIAENNALKIALESNRISATNIQISTSNIEASTNSLRHSIQELTTENIKLKTKNEVQYATIEYLFKEGNKQYDLTNKYTFMYMHYKYLHDHPDSDLEECYICMENKCTGLLECCQNELCGMCMYELNKKGKCFFCQKILDTSSSNS